MATVVSKKNTSQQARTDELIGGGIYLANSPARKRKGRHSIRRAQSMRTQRSGEDRKRVDQSASTTNQPLPQTPPSCITKVLKQALAPSRRATVPRCYAGNMSMYIKVVGFLYVEVLLGGLLLGKMFDQSDYLKRPDSNAMHAHVRGLL